MAIDANTLPDDPAILRDMLRAANDEIERLRSFISVLNRNRFGARSEKLDPDQLNLGLEDAEQELAASAAAIERRIGRPTNASSQRRNRGNLPAHLPRIERVVDIADKACPCCRGELHRIGEDVAERLDMVPAQFRVIVTRRPKYACRTCEGTVVQAPASAHVVEGGLPTEALIAQVAVSKYADHCPLYRQAGIYARQGIDLDRATLADWVGRAAWYLAPLHAALRADLNASEKLFADETTAPVLDPGRGRTKTGQFWAYARDDRPWGGTSPPAVAYIYAPDRTKARPREHLAGFRGVLQVDGYAAYGALAETGSITLALCWAHTRRKFYEIATAGPAPIAEEALRRIADLYKIEADIRGSAPEARVASRKERSKPIIDAFEPWLRAQLDTVSGKSPTAKAIRYALSHWAGLIRFIDDGRVELDTNTVERAIRPQALTRKNALFAGSDGGAQHWACLASLIETAKLNDIDPLAYLGDILARLAQGHPINRIAELLPWRWVPQASTV
ncbi:MAG: IS66 family transposase [Azospirillum sp.]|nr:IS66 family transposase [Azospirillum sp.]